MIDAIEKGVEHDAELHARERAPAWSGLVPDELSHNRAGRGERAAGWRRGIPPSRVRVAPVVDGS